MQVAHYVLAMRDGHLHSLDPLPAKGKGLFQYKLNIVHLIPRADRQVGDLTCGIRDCHVHSFDEDIIPNCRILLEIIN